MGVDVGLLFNAIFSTFAIIALGYALPASGFVTKDIGKGIGQLVGKLLLPCLLFEEIALLEINKIDWQLVGAIVVAKVITCVLTIFLWGLFDRSPERKQAAALAGIFVGNQNDLAMGLAIVPVLLPEYKSYLYVTALINLVVIVPTCILMVELSRNDSASHEKTSCCKIFVRVLLNPLVVSGFSGLMYKILLYPHVAGGLPGFLELPLTTAKNAFPCCALFLVGHGLLASGEESASGSFVAPIFLTTMKLVFTPICMQVCVRLLWRGMTCDMDVAQTFAYLYGTLPTAPSTIVIAASLGLPVQALCSSILLSTAAWAPLCFVGAITFSSSLDTQLESAIQIECLVSDVLSLLGLVLLLSSMLPSGSWRRFYMMLPFMICQLTFNAGDIACRLDRKSEIIFFVSCCARLGVACFGCLLVAEGIGLNAWWMLAGCITSCVAIVMTIFMTLPDAAIPEGSSYHGKCWWRSHEQQRCELYFYAVVLVIFCVLVICVALGRRRHHHNSEQVSLRNLDTLLATEALASQGTGIGTLDSREGALAGDAETSLEDAKRSWFPTYLERQDLHLNSPDCVWFVLMLALVGVILFMFLFLLGLVDERDTGLAGFSVVLLIQCLAANGMGFILYLILLDRTRNAKIDFKFMAAWCPILFDGGLRVNHEGFLRSVHSSRQVTPEMSRQVSPEIE